MPYRVDWIDLDASNAKVWGATSHQHAWERFVEGVKQAYDEVCIYNFNAGEGDPVLLARFAFNNGRLFNYARTDQRRKGIEGGASAHPSA